MKRSVFYLSDQTGLTAELLGQTLLSQFESIDFITQTLPYIDSEKKVLEAVDLINRNAQENGTKPILFSTLVQPELKAILHNSQSLMLDVFEHFIAPLEQAFQIHSTHRVGKPHSSENKEAYDNRIQAVNYALNTDDGLSIKQYAKADIILLGVSRSGKTPTALYLAMQFGIQAANYPITEDDLENHELPTWAEQFKDKLFGLKIEAHRLHEIRTERRANSPYTSLQQCEFEVKHIHKLYVREDIPTIDTTIRSIEEIATKIIAKTNLKR
ncbi:MAG: kinase/pyrophosphorylase [gamma proteobacterium symbiont of Lucinoma myriamae]|nr:kinase/pyrophosphorylase [gamma proteobacterium symbiont of Lucinoma myriamae]